ncbi:MAG: lipopolysaccharide biosynthesis protein [Candidatus Omnitrophica bacterium]|nr:lipopolysaccharide biosynthesis protein [Candidatus Omnitrophota bacterium]
MIHSHNKEDSLNRRYFFKLISNFAMLLSGVVTMILVPRSLGPAQYGNFSFLTDFFQRVTNSLGMGTSAAFFTKISQRQNEHKILIFYTYFTCVVIVVVAVFIAVCLYTDIHNAIWPDQKTPFILMAAVWAVLTWNLQNLNKVTDAYGLTVKAEKAQILQRLIAVCLIVSFFFSGRLHIGTLFIYHYLIMGVLHAFWICILFRSRPTLLHDLQKDFRLKKEELKLYYREFYDYCHPIIVMTFIGLFVGIFDRWLLQNYAGSVQQGFYSLSQRIGMLCFMFTSAMTPLITREFSVAFAENNIRHMGELFRKYIPLLYSLSAYFSCFLLFQADNLIQIIGGEEFQGAKMAVMIMAVYPIHQTYGQLSGSVFFATERTDLYRNITLIFLMIGLPITYILITPGAFGYNAGAVGLAVKMVCIQFFAVNVQLYYNTKLMNLNFWYYFFHQISCLSVFLLIAYGVSWGGEIIFKPFTETALIKFLVSGLIYTIFIGVLIKINPKIIGISQKQLNDFYAKMKTKVSIRK